MNNLESEEVPDGEIKYLEKINELQAAEINFLRELVIKLMSERTLSRARPNIENAEFEPIGGFTPLRERINQAEEASRLEQEKK